jgi:hypothetical protein
MKRRIRLLGFTATTWPRPCERGRIEVEDAPRG